MSRWRGRLGRAILVASVAGIVSGFGGSSSASNAGATGAEVSDISGAALKKSDAPPGYNHRYWKLFPKYRAKMKVGHPASSCTTPKGITKRNWKQGLAAELIKGKGLTTHTIAECIYLLKSDTAAHSVYVQGAAQQEATEGVKPLSLPSVGDEQIALSISSSVISGYVVFFRHQNAVVAIAYLSLDKPDLSESDFGTLTVNVDSRLM